MDKWIDLVISWMPFLVLIAIWFWVSRSMGMRAKSSSGATLIELYEQQVAEFAADERQFGADRDGAGKAGEFGEVVRPHPEEPRSGVSKDGTGHMVRDGAARLLTMRS